MNPELLEYFDACLLAAAREELGSIGAVVVAAKTYYFPEDPLEGGPARLGSKVRYAYPDSKVDKVPMESVGLIHYLTRMEDMPATAIRKLAEHLAKSSAIQMRAYILRDVEAKKPLPICQLTAKDREEMQWPF